MRDADRSQEPIRTPIEDGKEQNKEPVTENSVTDDFPQTPTNRVGIYLVVVGLIVITVAVILSRFPIPGDWVGIATSEEKSQVATEEVNGKITKTTTTIRTEPDKTLWDWMSLILAPATLAGLGFVFQSSQEQAKAAREGIAREAETAAKKRAEEQAKAEKERAEEQAKAEKERAEEQAKAEKERAEDRQRDDALEAYVNSISDLLIGKSLSILAKQNLKSEFFKEQKDLLDAGMNVIRARTLSIFRRFTDDEDRNRTDGERKGSILLFLYETGLIRKQKGDEQGQEDTELQQFQALLSLSGANLSGANLREANLREAVLIEVNLNKSNLIESVLSGANLSGANLSGANLFKADLSGANLRRANLGGAHLFEADLSCANLGGAHLFEADLFGADLFGAHIIEAVLVEANLSDANLMDVNLNKSNLSKANLSGADLSGADLSRAHLRDAHLSRAILSGADLSRAHLRDAHLIEANLRDAHLRDAHLSGATLLSVDLSGADLSGADLSGALLLSVDLSSVRPGTLTQEQLEGEKPPLLCKVKLPDEIEVDPQRLTSDCEILSEALLKRYPREFEDLTAVQTFMKEGLKF